MKMLFFFLSLWAQVEKRRVAVSPSSSIYSERKLLEKGFEWKKLDSLAASRTVEVDERGLVCGQSWQRWTKQCYKLMSIISYLLSLFRSALNNHYSRWIFLPINVRAIQSGQFKCCCFIQETPTFMI